MVKTQSKVFSETVQLRINYHKSCPMMYLYGENGVGIKEFADALNGHNFNIAVVNILHFNVVCIHYVKYLCPVE